MDRTKPMSTSTPKKNKSRNVGTKIEHEYNSISSKSEGERVACESIELFRKALKTQEGDPLTTFIEVTVPRVFSYLSMKEQDKISPEEQMEERIFTSEI